MRTTLESVARLAGVSKSTVSRALNGDPKVLPETRTRVIDAARALRYRPNRVASALRTRRTGLLGLVVNSLYNATFNTLAEVMQARAATLGYQVLVATTDGDPAREAAFLDMADEHHLDGVVVAGSGRNDDRINMLLDHGTAVVTMNREVPGTAAPSVMPAYRDAARLATEHLIALGHRRIGAIAGLDDFTSGREHHLGFIDVLESHGLTLDLRLVRRGPFDPAFGMRAAEELLGLRPPPTAVLVSNHEATFGVLPVLTERGVRIPAALSLVCTEDAPWFSWWHPRLTVIDVRPGDMAATALELLLAQIDHADVARDTHRLIQPRVVERESVGEPP